MEARVARRRTFDAPAVVLAALSASLRAPHGHVQKTLPNVIAIPGGVPIKVGNDVSGGVGLSRVPGVDEPCVMAGLDKVQDQLR
jgi:uncharacterized protein GlcG (DUF336 family)